MLRFLLEDFSKAASYFRWATTYSIIVGDLDLLFKQKLNLNMTQACVITVIASHQDGIPMTVLARESHLKSNTCTAAVKHLNEKDYVTRCSTDSDKRKVIVSLTQTGGEAFQQVMGVIKIYLDHIHEILTEEELKRLQHPVVSYSEYLKLSGFEDPFATEASCLITARFIIIAMSQRCKELGLTFNEARVLCYLEFATKGKHLSDISRELSIRQNILTLCINKLESKKLVKRSTDKDDHRAINIRMLKKGHSLAARVVENIEAYIKFNDLKMDEEPPEGIRKFLIKRINEA